MIYRDEPLLGEEGRKENNTPHLEEKIREVLDGQAFGVLCTQGMGQPYGSLVAYSFTEDLKNLFFATPRATRKYMLLRRCDRVSMVIDTRSRYPREMKKIQALTVTGRAKEMPAGDMCDRAVRCLGERHPYLEGFLESESTARFRIRVTRYFHVTRFQEVSQWTP